MLYASPCSFAVLDYRTDWENDSAIGDTIVFSSSLVIGQLYDRRYIVKMEVGTRIQPTPKDSGSCMLDMSFILYKRLCVNRTR